LGDNGLLLYHQFITAVHQALTAGVTRLFAVGTVFAFVAFLAAFALKEVGLQQDEFFQETGEPVGLSE
jgi:hypothetical protein